MSDAVGANPGTYNWDAEVAERWLALEDAMDRALEPFGAAGLARAQARPGEGAIDVGCGCGATLVALAGAVGGQGRVLGVDIAPAIVERARARTQGLPQVEVVVADAQTFAFSTDHDLVFSRYGVMFFRDEEAAFANLARALRPGGRLAFVCWRRFEENPWVTLPFAVVKKVLADAAPPPAQGPGPFTFGDSDRTSRLLARAGFRDIQLERFDEPVNFGADLASAVRLAMNTGPTGRALPGTDQATRAVVREKLAEALTPQLRPEGVLLPGSAWIVSARR